MTTLLGPIPLEHLVLCVADAGPGAQRPDPAEAQHFYLHAPWVGAVRNTAAALGCPFYILTTGHGLVKPTAVIGPYDLPIQTHAHEVSVYWRTTVPALLHAHKHQLLLFYAGGCPRDLYLELLLPLLRPLGISLLTFGRPAMVDADCLEPAARLLVEGTSLEALSSLLGQPDRLEFYYHA